MKTKNERSFITKNYFLKDSLFYSYSGNETYPSEMIFMLGCYIEPIQEGSRFGFIITHDYKSPLKLFGKFKEDRDEWVKVLVHASHTMQIQDDYKFQRICGTGKFSTVYRSVQKQTLDEVAIKVIDKDTLDDYEK